MPKIYALTSIILENCKFDHLDAYMEIALVADRSIRSGQVRVPCSFSIDNDCLLKLQRTKVQRLQRCPELLRTAYYIIRDIHNFAGFSQRPAQRRAKAARERRPQKLKFCFNQHTNESATQRAPIASAVQLLKNAHAGTYSALETHSGKAKYNALADIPTKRPVRPAARPMGSFFR